MVEKINKTEVLPAVKVTPDEKDIIRRAAAIDCRNTSNFILASALAAARKIIKSKM